MESIIHFITENVHFAPYIIFFLILLAGVNVPLSEDLLVLAGGYLAGGFAPDYALLWFAIIFAACWISAWESYWIGWRYGPKLYELGWFKRWLTPSFIEKLHGYYEKYGIWTFIVGRFIPGGVRNALFISCGLGKMPFTTFLFRDGIGCIIACSTLFFIGYSFADKDNIIFSVAHTYRVFVLIIILLIVAINFLVYFYFRRQTH